ncbi:putative ribonuclease H-like domain-containing protein [Tanacetum coccineum]
MLNKLSMSKRTKVGLGFKGTLAKCSVYLSRPSTHVPRETCWKEVNPLYSWFVKAGEMHAVPPSITGTYMPSPYKSDIEKTQTQRHYASCDSSLKTKTKDFPPAVDIQTLPESDVEDPNSTTGSPSFSCSENVKSPRIIYYVPCKSKAASVPAGSRNSPASVTAGGSDPAASRNRPAVNSADRPHPAGWSKRPATVSAGRPVSAGWLNPAARPYFRPSSGDPSTDNDIGIVDSGCSRSMTGNKEKLDDFVQIKGGIVKFGGGDGRISGKGTIRTSKLDFENVYYVEELQHFNLFSVSQICDKKNKVLFTDTDCLVLSEEFQLPDESQVVLRIPREHDLYTFSISDLQPEQKVTCLVAKASLDESTRWHRRMAHVNFKTINKLAKEGLVDGLPLKVFTNEHNCVACNKGKQHKASYKHISAVRLITETLQLLHMDLFGPTNIRSIDQKYYSLVVTDDFSRFTWTFYLGTKDETFYVLKEFIALIENQLNKKVKGIRCDNGTEFKNAKLIELCGEKGIKRDYSNPRTPQQNGVAERKNRTLIEAARTMLADSKLPTMFWTEAVSTACYVLNRVSITNPHNKTPYQLISGKVPQIGHLKPFGCQVTILNTSDHLGKFEEGKAVEVILELVNEWKLSYMQVLPQAMQQQRILSQAEAEIRNQGVYADRDPAGIDSAGGVSARIILLLVVILLLVILMVLFNLLGSYDPVLRAILLPVHLFLDFIPVMLMSHTLPLRQFHWGSSVTLANLAHAVVVHPFTKRVNTINLSLRILGDLCFSSSDKKAELKNPKIEEEVYVTQPKGFEDPYFPKHVYRVVKALYGLHQAPRAWYARLSAFLLQHNYRRGTIDKTLFIKKDSRDILLVQVYVDDIIFGSTNKAWCEEFEVLMKGEFEMSAMGEMNFFLGLQVKQLPDGIFISQDKYVKDMLTKFDMESVRTATTPYEAAKTKLKDETDPPVNVHLYRSMIGSLMYLTASRPDIMFAVSACSRHQVTPLTSHLNAVKKIFKYLKGQPKFGLWYPKDSPFQRLISWQCKKQTIVATSSTEAKYVAAASCCAQIHTDDNVADLLTKAFDGPRFEYLGGPYWNGGYGDLWDIIFHVIAVVNTAASSMDSADGSVWLTLSDAEYIMLAGVLHAVKHLYFMLLNCFCCAQFDIAGWLVSATSHFVSAGSLQSCWCGRSSNEDNAAANEAVGSATEAHLVPHSPVVSPVREPTPERQPVSERPPSPSPTIPETEWVVPNPVSPVTDWRPWP